MGSNTHYWSHDHTISLITKALSNNQIVLSSTDTVPGLMAIPSLSTFNFLNEMKERHDKPYLLLVNDKEKVEEFAELHPEINVACLMDECWPGPLTIIFKARPELPAWMVSPQRTIAIRVPNHHGLRAVLKEIPAIFSTSANISGQPVPLSIDEVNPKLKDQVALIVDDEELKLPRVSTIIDCSQLPIRVVRQGVYPIERLESIYGEPFKR